MTAQRRLIIVCVLTLFCSLHGLAQKSALTVRSADSTAFFLIISGELQNGIPKAEVDAGIFFPRTLPVDILLADSVTTASFSLKISEGFRYVYELHRLNDELRLLPFSKSRMLSSVDEAESEVQGSSPSANDYPVDSVLSSIALPKYDGPRGCDFPLDPSEMESLSAELSDLLFERERKSLILKTAKEQCLSVSQFSTLLAFIDLEDHKLQLVRQALPNLYDQANNAQLEDSFQLSSSKETLREILK